MANVAQTHVERERSGQATARTLSILAALAVDVGLVWLLFFRAKYNPPVGEAEMFWVRVLAAFGAYAVFQQWTLANQTGRGDDFSAALDKFVAASPIVVAAVLEAYWIGAEFDCGPVLATPCGRGVVVCVRPDGLLCNRHHQSAPQGTPVQCRRQCLTSAQP